MGETVKPHTLKDGPDSIRRFKGGDFSVLKRILNHSQGVFVRRSVSQLAQIFDGVFRVPHTINSFEPLTYFRWRVHVNRVLDRKVHGQDIRCGNLACSERFFPACLRVARSHSGVCGEVRTGTHQTVARAIRSEDSLPSASGAMVHDQRLAVLAHHL